jgi:hypothetical protein
VLEPRTRALLSRYGLTVEALADPHAAERELSRALLPDDVTGALGALREMLATSVGALTSAADPLVPEAVPEGFARDVMHRIERLERRYRAAVRRREEERFRDLARLRGALYPGGVRQERALNLLPLLARHGPALVDAMLGEARMQAREIVEAPGRTPVAGAARASSTTSTAGSAGAAGAAGAAATH